MTEQIITHARISCGAPMAFGAVHGGRRPGLDLHRTSSNGTPSVSAGMSKERRPLRRRCKPISMVACRDVWLDRVPARLGSKEPWDAIRLPSICRTTSPTRFSSSASSRPTPSSPSPRPTASPMRFNRTLKEQIIHGSQVYRNFAELRAYRRASRLRRTLQCPVDREKNDYLSPESSSSGVARRDLNQSPPSKRQTCVQGTGCEYTGSPIFDFERPETVYGNIWGSGSGKGCTRETCNAIVNSEFTFVYILSSQNMPNFILVPVVFLRGYWE